MERVKFKHWLRDTPPARFLVQKGVVSLDWYTRNGFQKLARARGELGGYTTQNVTVETALACSTVFACAHVISEDVASLPLALYERTPDGKVPMRPPISGALSEMQKLYELLHDEPNPNNTAMEFREMLTHHVVLWGNGYAIKRYSNEKTPRLIALDPVEHPTDMRVARDEKGAIVYTHKPGTKNEKKYSSDQIFHLRGLGDGLVGKSVIDYARQSIDYSIAAQEYGSRFLGQGGRPMGVLTHPGILESEGEDKLRERFQQVHGGLSNSHKLLILEEGMKFEAIGMSAEAMQFLEARQFQVPDICRFFRMPPHKVQDLSRATFSNIEHEQLSYYTDVLRPYLVRWEQAIRRQLLTPDQKRRYFAEHTIEGLLRGDFESQMKGLSTALQSGLLSINEGRDILNRNKVEGGDKYRVQMQMVDIQSEGAGATVTQ